MCTYRRVSLNLLAIATTLAWSTRDASSQGRDLIVDANKGPYKEISAALAAARDGDNILVRAGDYSSFRATKAVRILCAPGTKVVRPVNSVIRIEGIPKGKRFFLSGIRVDKNVARLEIFDCPGLVRIWNYSNHVATTLGVHVRKSASVVFDSLWTEKPSVKIESSTVAIVDSLLLAYGSNTKLPALELDKSVVELTRTICNTVAKSTARGVEMQNSVLRLTHWGTVGGNDCATNLVVRGTGTLVYPKGITFVSCNKNSPAPIDKRIVQRVIASAGLSFPEVLEIGKTYVCRLQAGSGVPYAIFIGAPVPTPFVAQLENVFWLANPLFLAGGVTAAGQANVVIQVPNAAALRGIHFGAQALTRDANRWLLSNPVLSTVR